MKSYAELGHGPLLIKCFHLSLSLHIFLAFSHFFLLLHMPFSFLPSTFFSVFSLFHLLLIRVLSSQCFVSHSCHLPNHLICPYWIVTSIDSTFSFSSFRILSNLVLFFILFGNLVSVLFIFLLSFIWGSRLAWTCRYWFYDSSDHFYLYFLGDFFLLGNDVFIALFGKS